MKQTLFIEKGDIVVLPKEHHKINNICAIIYDQISELFTKKNYQRLLYTNLKFDENSLNLEQLQNNEIHILDFLKVNELNDELESLLTKHILLTVVSDFVNFVFESLSCAKKCKSTVAYALLRKPYTDELLLLEQLLGNRNEFINNFYHDGDPINYDPSSNKANKKEIIEKAVKKIEMNFFYKSDFIFELRYDKTFVRGINGISNKALHIVTRDRNYKTTEQNFNFIFSRQEDIFNQLKNYYFTIPHLLFYSASVIDEIAFSFLEVDDEENQTLKTLKQFTRLIGFILFTEENNVTKKAENDKLFESISESLKLECEKCNGISIIERTEYERFFYLKTLSCRQCSSDLMKSKKNIIKIEKTLK